MGENPERPPRSPCAACKSLDHVSPDLWREYEFGELRRDARLDNVKVAVSLSFYVSYFNDFFLSFQSMNKKKSGKLTNKVSLKTQEKFDKVVHLL